jgi:hypothetical protein
VGAGALRVYVESEESVEETPVLVVVRHEKGVLSWQLPLMLQVHYKLDKFYYTVFNVMFLTQISLGPFLFFGLLNTVYLITKK